MDCGVQEETLFSWFLERDPRLGEHIESCAACRDIHQYWQTVKDAIRTLPGAEGETPPRIVGGYKILAQLGAGGQAVVYDAIQPETHRPVALKVFNPGAAPNPGALQRIKQEARILARLHHPGIAIVYEARATDDDRYYIAMERVRGQPLDQYLTEHKFTPRRITQLFLNVLDAVSLAHGAGVIHSDLKPSNILVTPEGRPVLVDFGLAHVRAADGGGSDAARGAGLWYGTPEYMSPEQVRGETPLDERSDVYSLGVILYRALTGEPPYRVALETAEQIICHQNPPRPRSINRRIPAGVQAAVLKALAKDPGRRFASAAAFAEELRGSAHGFFQRGSLRNTLAACSLLVVVLGMSLYSLHYVNQEARRLRILAALFNTSPGFRPEWCGLSRAELHSVLISQYTRYDLEAHRANLEEQVGDQLALLNDHEGAESYYLRSRARLDGLNRQNPANLQRIAALNFKRGRVLTAWRGREEDALVAIDAALTSVLELPALTDNYYVEFVIGLSTYLAEEGRAEMARAVLSRPLGALREADVDDDDARIQRLLDARAILDEPP